MSTSSIPRVSFLRCRSLAALAFAAFFAPLLPASAFVPPSAGRRLLDPGPPASKMSARPADPAPSGDAPPTPAVDLDRAKSLVAAAISAGAPAYNAGNVGECAGTYKSAAAELVPILPPPLRSALEGTLEKVCADGGGDDDDAVAWALRRQFDAILEYRPPYLPTKQEGGGAEGFTLEPFTERQLPARPLPVLDDVMGGMSLGRWDPENNAFLGETSLENNGGFASLRWRFDPVQNWSYAKGVYLKVRHSEPGEHTFRLILKDATCEMVRGANFKAVFCNPEDEDGPILVPFDAFDQMEQMGRPLQGPVLNRGAVTEVGLMAIKPSVVGEFQLKIEEWGLYC